AREAAQQSRRIAPPDIAHPVKLADALKQEAAVRIVLSESEREIELTETLSAASPTSLALAIGPEGGWTDEELRIFADSGWTSASLGDTILRAETAAIAALAVARALI